jgi:hypothetical protein
VHSRQKAGTLREPREEIQQGNLQEGHGLPTTISLQLSDDQLNTLADSITAAQVIPTAVTSEHHELGNFSESAQDASLFQIPSVNE